MNQPGRVIRDGFGRLLSGAYCVLLSGPLLADSQPLATWRIDLPKGCAATMQTVEANWLHDESAQQALKEHPDAILKPDFSNMPAHTWLDLNACFAGDATFLPAQWRMLPVAGYTAVYAVDHAPEPMIQNEFDQFGRWIESGQYAQGWAFLPFLDMDTALVALPKRIRSADFDGVRVLVQFDNDGANLLRRGRVLYVYQGFNADRSLFQLMIVPLTHADFPNDEATAHLGFDLDQLYASHEQALQYQQKLEPWLDARVQKMTPSLQTLDDMILSVQVAH